MMLVEPVLPRNKTKQKWTKPNYTSVVGVSVAAMATASRLDCKTLRLER